MKVVKLGYLKCTEIRKFKLTFILGNNRVNIEYLYN